MRYEQTSFKVLALLTAMTVLGACGGQETPPMEDAAPAAAAPPTPDSYTLVAEDGAWSADIAPSGIVFRLKKNDSLMFEFKEPSVSGALSDYDVLATGKDTVRLTISMATTKCTDKQGAEYSHMVQVWLTGGRTLTSRGCANKKM